MEMPSERQIAEAIVDAKLAGETEEELHQRIDAMCRLSDEDLAALGIGPTPERNESEPAATQQPMPEAESVHDFDPIPVKPRHDGWTAERQRVFIQCLAETGCVSEACAEVGITPRSAYRLRDRPDAKAFRLAWLHAQTQAVTRLTAIAFERAIHGSSEQFFRDGVLVAERRKPSDRLLMFLLKHFDPVSFGWMEGKPVAPEITDPRWDAIAELPKEVRKLKDVDRDVCPADQISGADLIDAPASA